MDSRPKRILFRLADAVVSLASIFLLLDAALGFTWHQETRPAQSQYVSQAIDYTSLSTSCTGGFSNKRTTDGVTQIAAHGTPFNAYQITLTNMGDTVITVRSVTVDLAGSRNEVFAQHRANLGDGAGITLGLGQSRQIVETSGITHPVASCAILGWQS